MVEMFLALGAICAGLCLMEALGRILKYLFKNDNPRNRNRRVN